MLFAYSNNKNYKDKSTDEKKPAEAGFFNDIELFLDN